jgi:hypothetical protein
MIYMHPSSLCPPTQAFVVAPRFEANTFLNKVPTYMFLLELCQILNHF